MTKRAILKIANKHDLTGSQVMILMMMQDQELPTMQTLANALSCDASNITGVIDSLENKRLVSRREKPGDRRVKVVQLEPAGQALANLLLSDAAIERSRAFASQLTSEEMRTLAGLVRKLSQAE